ncbi:hypothetical protein [Desulforhabdus amnigena]|uniref:Uncharacterized protein n=1 Tax=Desulforhabdus amnigena TaxID=40218 RepID=A0A9W6D2J4_9BACT|nr:hypothetical protein [Desulforhabdus amnigena]NLJ28410.1 hypothetical protein [Deltaproteobacteria bacterium]GLI33428.1 hypothetical protein DAMNIGENAA_08610 [Desulforhabdus amnigena]
MEVESKLIPILREGIDVIKMVFFQKLKSHLEMKYSSLEKASIGKLAGAIINELFGTIHLDGPFADFAEENKAKIEQETAQVAVHLKEMRIPLTDALRMQFLCDYREGIDSTHLLSKARDLGILIADREVPLPAQFMNLVRNLGSTVGILVRS